MWTYLAIFLCLFFLLLIFVRRVLLTLLKKPEVFVEVENGDNDDAKDDGPKKRFSKDEKSEMERLYKRSIALIKKKEPKEAVKTLVQALSVDPGYLDALKELGRLYLDQKMWGKASAVYNTLAEKTKDPVDFSHLGLAFYNAGEFDDAAKAYQSAISKDPKRHQRYVSLGHVYLDSDKLPLALIAFKKALEKEPENVDYMLLVADVHKRLEQFDDARTMLDAAIETNPMGKMAKKMLEELKKVERAAKKNS